MRRFRSRPKKYKPPPRLVESRIVWHDDGPEIVLPIVVHAQTGYANASWQTRGDTKAEQKAFVLQQLRVRLPMVMKPRLSHITYTRISPRTMDRRDNLPWSLKHVVDITSYWVLDGSPNVPKTIGRFDDRLGNEGITWDYKQRTEGKAQGIAIRFHLISEPRSPT